MTLLRFYELINAWGISEPAQMPVRPTQRMFDTY